MSATNTAAGQDPAMRHQNTGAPPALTAVAVLLAIAGAKLWLVGANGGITPFWDQWDAEADRLYRPWLEGRLGWTDLVAPHNEHRILASRLVALGLLEANGWWDTRLQMAVNALLHTAALGAFLLAIRPALDRAGFLVAGAATIVLFAPPFGWENTLAAFQSQFSLLALVSIPALALLTATPALSWRWWAGVLLAAASLLTMASGILVFAAAIGLVLARAAASRTISAAEIGGLAALALAATLLSQTLASVSGHEALRAQSPAQLLEAAGAVLSWPVRTPAAAILIWLLPAALLARLIVERAPHTDTAWIMIALAGWIGLQDLALAYARADAPLSSRYLDLVALGPVVALASGWVLLRRLTGIPRLGAATVLTLAATATALSAAVGAAGPLPREIAQRHAQTEAQTRNLRAYIMTGDGAHLRDKPHLDIPYPSAERLQSLVDLPVVRGLLPADLGVTPAERRAARDRLALRGVAEPLLQAMKSLLFTAAPAILFAGLALFAFAAWDAWRRRRRAIAPAAGSP
jgi:hypothetical protein